MSVNLSSTTPAAPSGSTNITWQKDAAGNVSAYITSPVELIGDGFDATAQVADITATDLITSPTAGRYRISAYIIVTTVGTTSTLPKITILWDDVDNGQPQTFDITPTNAGNALTTLQQGDVFLSVGASSPLQFQTTGYASTGTSMQFAIHITVEAL